MKNGSLPCAYCGRYGSSHMEGCPESFENPMDKYNADERYHFGYKRGKSGLSFPRYNLNPTYLLGYLQGVISLQKGPWDMSQIQDLILEAKKVLAEKFLK